MQLAIAILASDIPAFILCIMALAVAWGMGTFVFHKNSHGLPVCCRCATLLAIANWIGFTPAERMLSLGRTMP